MTTTKGNDAAEVTEEQVREFCAYYGVWLYCMGDPCDPHTTGVFRVGTNEFPSRGITVPVSLVREWLDKPPFVGEGI